MQELRVCKNWLPLTNKRVSAACRVTGFPRCAWYREDQAIAQARRDAPVIDALNQPVNLHPRWGFGKSCQFIRNQGHRGNHKRFWCVYCHLGLNLKRKVKKCPPICPHQLLDVSPKNQPHLVDEFRERHTAHRHELSHLKHPRRRRTRRHCASKWIPPSSLEQ